MEEETLELWGVRGVLAEQYFPPEYTGRNGRRDAHVSHRRERNKSNVCINPS